MPYDRARAIELGKLIDFAYQQFIHRADAAFVWQPPGYNVIQVLSCANPAPAVPFGFIAQQGSTLFLVIRGTQQPFEWLENALIKPSGFRPSWGSTTLGFLETYNQLSPQILAAVVPLAETKAITNVFVTGHSLGAALAQLATAELFTQNVISTLYTFCGPRAGDAAFATSFAASGLESWRIFNTEDIVPGLPLAALDLNAAATGLADSSIELAVKLLLSLNQFSYSHVQSPVAVTFNTGTLAGNHSLDNVYGHL